MMHGCALFVPLGRTDFSGRLEAVMAGSMPAMTAYLSAPDQRPLSGST